MFMGDQLSVDNAIIDVIATDLRYRYLHFDSVY